MRGEQLAVSSNDRSVDINYPLLGMARLNYCVKNAANIEIEKVGVAGDGAGIAVRFFNDYRDCVD